MILQDIVDRITRIRIETGKEPSAIYLDSDEVDNLLDEASGMDEALSRELVRAQGIKINGVPVLPLEVMW